MSDRAAVRGVIDEYYRTMAKAARTEEILTRHAQVMDAYDPEKTAGLVLDEWGTWYDVEPGTHPGFLFQQNSLRDALGAHNTTENPDTVRPEPLDGVSTEGSLLRVPLPPHAFATVTLPVPG